jgi:hypothetical protein
MKGKGSNCGDLGIGTAAHIYPFVLRTRSFAAATGDLAKPQSFGIHKEVVCDGAKDCCKEVGRPTRPVLRCDAFLSHLNTGRVGRPTSLQQSSITKEASHLRTPSFSFV